MEIEVLEILIFGIFSLSVSVASNVPLLSTSELLRGISDIPHFVLFYNENEKDDLEYKVRLPKLNDILERLAPDFNNEEPQKIAISKVDCAAEAEFCSGTCYELVPNL